MVVERWVRRRCASGKFFNLVSLNKAIRQKLAELNERAFRGEPTSRRELFEELERPALKALPAQRYELAEWKKVTVNIDYHVEYSDSSGHHYYSVPYTSCTKSFKPCGPPGPCQVQSGPPGGVSARESMAVLLCDQQYVVVALRIAYVFLY